MKKVFNLSLHRSGTQSFSKFCSDNGLRSAHWPGDWFDQECAAIVPEIVQSPFVFPLDKVWNIAAQAGLIDNNDIFSDMPYCLMHQQAFKNLGGSNVKFMLVYREINGWIASVRKHMANREMAYLEKILYRHYIPHNPTEIFSNYTNEQLRIAYNTHIMNVSSVAATYNLPIAYFSLDDPNLGYRIAEYIGFDPKVPMQHVDYATSG